jgi:L-2-hydroxyglutarate oxidase LhgO
MITMIQEGYGAIWERVYKRDNLDVVFNFEVTAISRQNDKVIINAEIIMVQRKPSLEWNLITLLLQLL